MTTQLNRDEREHSDGTTKVVVAAETKENSQENEDNSAKIEIKEKVVEIAKEIDQTENTSMPVRHPIETVYVTSVTEKFKFKSNH